MVQRFILNRNGMKRGLAEASKGRRPYEEQSQDSELTCEQELDFSYRVSRKFHTPLQLYKKGPSHEGRTPISVRPSDSSAHTSRPWLFAAGCAGHVHHTQKRYRGGELSARYSRQSVVRSGGRLTEYSRLYDRHQR